jgi:hypothetical protein
MIRVGWLHFADAEKVREKFSKLLLGEDMSGTGKGVTSALALSNAITNLAGNKNFSFSAHQESFLSFPFLNTIYFLPRFHNLSQSARFVVETLINCAFFLPHDAIFFSFCVW